MKRETPQQKYDTFYGMPIPKLAITLASEGLTCMETSDLWLGHMKYNYGYFGMIDKTLSGFVVLDNTDDDYLLYDAREPDGQGERGRGQVWFQSHDDRTLRLDFDSLEQYQQFLIDEEDLQLKAAELDEKYWDEMTEEEQQFDYYDAREELKQKYRPEPKPSSLAISTKALLHRYLWLVWFFERPTKYKPEAECGGANMRYLWQAPTDCITAFEQERQYLSSDIHLALYWLLHMTAMADYARVAEILELCAANEQPLWQHFAAVTGSLRLGDDVPHQAELTRRQSDFLLDNFHDQAQSFEPMLRAYCLHPQARFAAKACHAYCAAVEENRLDELRSATEAFSEDHPGIGYIRCQLDGIESEHKLQYAKRIVEEYQAADEGERKSVRHHVLKLCRDDGDEPWRLHLKKWFIESHASAFEGDK